MIKKTHLAVGLAIGLYFLPFVNYKLFFIPVILIASLLPDIDSGFSTVGRKKVFRPVQWFFEHRGPLHSYTFCIGFSLLFTLFYPIFALPFFLGYISHLFLDSFTVRGIKPFWPFRFVSKGVVKSGGLTDRTLFYTFLVFNIFLLILLFA